MTTASPDCLFCKIIDGRIPARIAHQDDKVVAFHDVNPQAPRHLLICPREHIATLNDLQPHHEALIGHAVLVARQLAGGLGDDGDGYRVVMNCGPAAGQSVFHIHVHLLGGRSFGWPPG